MSSADSAETATAPPSLEGGQQPRSITIPSQINSYSAKVGELFLTASSAFEKLGEITMNLNSTNLDPSENRWTETEIDALRNAIMRFSAELEDVSESLAARTKLMIRKDIKRRTLQMGEMSGGATMSTAARTTFKPVSNMTKHEQVPMDSLHGAATTDSTQSVESTSAAGDVHVISSQEISSAQDKPPQLTPAEPTRQDQHPSPFNTTIIRRYPPGTGQQVTIRRVPITALSRPIGQSVRLVNTAPGSAPPSGGPQVVRHRVVPSGANTSGSQPYLPTNRHMPYARVTTNSPQLVSASSTRLIPASTVSAVKSESNSAWTTQAWRRR